jgi:hypothetical protein
VAIVLLDIGKRKPLSVAAHVKRDAQQGFKLFEAHPRPPISGRRYNSTTGTAHCLSEGGFEGFGILVHLLVVVIPRGRAQESMSAQRRRSRDILQRF